MRIDFGGEFGAFVKIGGKEKALAAKRIGDTQWPPAQATIHWVTSRFLLSKLLRTLSIYRAGTCLIGSECWCIDREENGIGFALLDGMKKFAISAGERRSNGVDFALEAIGEIDLADSVAIFFAPGEINPKMVSGPDRIISLELTIHLNTVL